MCARMCIRIVRKDGVIYAQECGDMCEGIVRKNVGGQVYSKVSA
jgi:hypothetical protein